LIGITTGHSRPLALWIVTISIASSAASMRPSGAPHQGPWQEGKLRPGSLFLVGDPKQAIYRFRGADIEAYQHCCELIRAQDAGAILPATFELRGDELDRAIIDATTYLVGAVEILRSGRLAPRWEKDAHYDDMRLALPALSSFLDVIRARARFILIFSLATYPSTPRAHDRL
jgi:hypothetical protein